jgi:hypothetical protein
VATVAEVLALDIGRVSTVGAASVEAGGGELGVDGRKAANDVAVRIDGEWVSRTKRVAPTSARVMSRQIGSAVAASRSGCFDAAVPKWSSNDGV